MTRTVTGVARGIALVLCLCSVSASAADQILTPEGLGPVRIGMTVEQAERALGAKLKPLNKADGFSDESCWETHSLSDPDPAVSYMVWNGKIVRIAIHGYHEEKNWKTVPPFATEKGIRIGATNTEVKEAYGKNLVIRPGFDANDDKDENSLLMTVFTKDKRSGIAFDTLGTKVWSFRAGLAKAIRMTEGCL